MHRRTKTALTLIAATALLASSCVPVHPERPVETPVAAGETFSLGGEAEFERQWWKSFDSEELDGLVEKALHSNLDLKQALARIEQNRALANKAGAGMLPTLTADGTGSRIRQKSLANEALTGKSISERRNWSVDFIAAYELDVWGRVRNQRKAGVYAWAASAEDYDAAEISIAAEVTSTWLELQTQRAQLELQKKQIETTTKYLELIELKFSNGQAVASDVYGQKQQLAGIKARAPLLRANIKILENRLAVILGERPGNIGEISRSDLPDLPPVPKTGLQSELILSRPDIRAARYRVASLDRKVASAMADRLPVISLSAKFGDSSEKMNMLFDNWLLTLAANLTQPLFDGGSRRAEVQYQRGLLEERINVYGKQVLVAIREVEDALTRETEQANFLKLLQEQVDIARKTLETSRKRFADGDGDYLTVLTALRAVQSLEQDELDAHYNLLAYRISLYKALGTSWNKRKLPVVEALIKTDRGEEQR